jgi:hypothetical protein
MPRTLSLFITTAIAVVALVMAAGVAGAKKSKKPTYCKSVVVHVENAGYRFFNIKPSGINCATARRTLQRKSKSGFDLGTGASGGGWTCKTGYSKPYTFPGVCRKGKHERIHYIYSDRL